MLYTLSKCGTGVTFYLGTKVNSAYAWKTAIIFRPKYVIVLVILDLNMKSDALVIGI